MFDAADPAPETLSDLLAALVAATASGSPHPADWAHRQVHFRILEQALGTLDRPVADLETLLPEDIADLPAHVRDRIPGNAPVTISTMRAKLRRARAVFRPDLYPFDALRAHAETAGIRWGNHWYALRAAIEASRLAHPVEIDSGWIAAQLSDVSEKDEPRMRGHFFALVRASRLEEVQAQGLLRSDLELPPTLSQTRQNVTLPGWLQEIYDAQNRRIQNAILRVWRTMHGLDLSAGCADDILAHIEAGRLTHAAANAAETIAPKTWRRYIGDLYRLLLSRVPDPTRYAARLKDNTGRKRTVRPRKPKPFRQTASYRFVAEAIATLQPPVPEEADIILTRENWPRVVDSMQNLGVARGYSSDVTRKRIDRARQVLGQLATTPVPRISRNAAKPLSAPPPKPELPRKPSRTPTLPKSLCEQAWEPMDLRGYTGNAQRSMIAELGKAHRAGMAAKALSAESSLQDVAAYGAANMPGRTGTDLERMLEILRLCEDGNWRAFLRALRAAGISLHEDPSGRLFSETDGAPPSSITREWAWSRELALTPEGRKSFSRAIDQLDSLRVVENLLPLLPAERIGPLQSSPLHPGRRHQHAQYPLPRTIEAEAEALGLDPDGQDWFDLMSGLHSLHGAARNAGLLKERDIDCATLLGSPMFDALKRTGVISDGALNTARRRTVALRPDETRTTPADRWRKLMAEIRTRGLHRPNAAGAARIPGYYAVRREALADGLGPEGVSSQWAMSILARIGQDRGKRSTFRQGLRFLTEMRCNSDIPPDLLPPAPLDDEFLAVRRGGRHAAPRH